MAKKPELEFHGLDVKSLSLSSLTLGARFQVHNPNSFDITINKIVYDLKVNEKDFAAGETSDSINIDGDETKIIELPVKIKYADLVKTIRNFAETKQSKYLLNGSVKSGMFEIPFKEQGELELPISN